MIKIIWKLSYTSQVAATLETLTVNLPLEHGAP